MSNITELCKMGDYSVATRCPYPIWNEYARNAEYSNRDKLLNEEISRYTNEMRNAQKDYLKYMQDIRYEELDKNSQYSLIKKQKETEIIDLQNKINGLEDKLKSEYTQKEKDITDAYYSMIGSIDNNLADQIKEKRKILNDLQSKYPNI